MGIVQAIRHIQPLLGKKITMLFDSVSHDFLGIELTEMKSKFDFNFDNLESFSVASVDGKKVAYMDAVQCLFFFTVAVDRERQNLEKLLEQN